MICATWVDLKGIILSKKATSKGYTLYNSSYIKFSTVKNLEMENRSVVAKETGEVREGCDYEGVARGKSFVVIE